MISNTIFRPPLRPASGGETKEVNMFNVTSGDLQARTTQELTALFNHIQLNVGWLKNPSAERSAALRLLAMIRVERGRRLLFRL